MTKGCTYGQRSKSLQQRFNEKIVRQENGCLAWSSARNARGYGLFWVGGKKRTEFAHRVAYRIANPGVELSFYTVILHTCDNPSCVNSEHLSLGTHQDNKLDAVKKKRHAFGERNGGGGKLTEAQVREILASRAELTQREAATKYGVGASTIEKIVNRRIWKHVV